jgi:hypothetical protein
MLSAQTFVQSKQDSRVLLTVGGLSQSLHVADFIMVCFRRVKAGVTTGPVATTG